MPRYTGVTLFSYTSYTVFCVPVIWLFESFRLSGCLAPNHPILPWKWEITNHGPTQVFSLLSCVWAYSILLKTMFGKNTRHIYCYLTLGSSHWEKFNGAASLKLLGVNVIASTSTPTAGKVVFIVSFPSFPSNLQMTSTLRYEKRLVGSREEWWDESIRLFHTGRGIWIIS